MLTRPHVVLAVFVLLLSASSVAFRFLSIFGHNESQKECGTPCYLRNAHGVRCVKLSNAAKSDVLMPVIGLGTGAYGEKDGSYGQFWDDSVSELATTNWLELGGRRIDTSLDYQDQRGIGRAIKRSGIPRSEIFITSKVGPRFMFGYDETLQQFDQILEELQTDYIDLLLIHFPGHTPIELPNGTSSFDHKSPCFKGETSYKKCRLESWRALEHLFNKTNKVRAIGVSNYEAKHILEILQLGSLVPAVNQFEFHPYWHQDSLVAFCQELDIVVNGYAPLGAPDYMTYGTVMKKWNRSIANESVVLDIARRLGKTPAQVLLRWSLQHNLVINPRSTSREHMEENLDIFDFELDESEVFAISSMKAPMLGPKKVCPDPKLMI